MMRDGVASGEADRMSWDGIRIVTGSGETRFITAARIPLRDQGSMVTTVVDVTEKLRASEEIRRINAELELRDQLAKAGLEPVAGDPLSEGEVGGR